MVKSKKNIRGIIVMTLVATTLIFSGSANSVANASTINTQNYKLADSIEEGVVLHAWNWSFNTIKDNLDAIADAGYTSIQVSPIQGTKESTKKTSYWWLLYQPTNFSIGNAQLGTREQFKELCDAAEAKGIKIIVDVVANHTANAGGGNDQYYPSKSVDPDLLNDPKCWHEHKPVSDWNDRGQVTQYCIGLPDLNTSNEKVQNKIISYLNDCIDCGADGFRFDAAKHIELPKDSESVGASEFWPNVLNSLNKKVFVYGEVLQGGADNFAAYTKYMDVLAPSYGDNIRSAVGYSGSKNVYAARDYSANGVTASHLVTEVETHDTYANNNFKGTSSSMNDWQLKMGWALIAARADSVPLYFDRPTSTTGDMGAAGNTNWKDPDVVAVNKFHNLMAGENEYLRPQSNNVTMIERGTKGAVIINLDGATTINTTTNLASNTYTNHASTGGTFTVSNGKITGNLPAGITVLYNEEDPKTMVSISKEDCSFTDSLTLTLGAKNSTSATYSIGETEKAYIDGQTITIGKDAKVGDKITVTLTATNGTNTATKTYTYTKATVAAGSKVYFYNTNNWSNPYVYVYSGSTAYKIAAWPGIAMTKVSDGLYSYAIPEGVGDAKVIFSDKGNSQYPASGQEGLAITVGSSMEYKNGIWQAYQEDKKPEVSISKEDCTFTDSLTLTLGVKNSTSATYSINGEAAKAYTDGQTIPIGKDAKAGDKVTVTLTAIKETNTATKTYTYTKVAVAAGSKLYFYNTNNWSNPYVYVYSGSTADKIEAWPGIAMAKVSEGLYSYTIPEGFGDAKVIFSNKGNSQYPGSGQEGLAIKAGSSMAYKNGAWTSYTE